MPASRSVISSASMKPFMAFRRSRKKTDSPAPSTSLVSKCQATIPYTVLHSFVSLPPSWLVSPNRNPAPPPFVFPRLNHGFDSCRDEGMDGASTARRQFSMDEEDELLQYAIQQSIIDVGSENDQVDIWEALKAQKPSQPNTPQMNRANRSSLPPRPSSSLGLPMSTEEQHLQRYPPHSAVSITRRLRSNTRRSVVSRFSKMSSICLFWACFGPSGSSF